MEGSFRQKRQDSRDRARKASRRRPRAMCRQDVLRSGETGLVEVDSSERLGLGEEGRLAVGGIVAEWEYAVNTFEPLVSSIEFWARGHLGSQRAGEPLVSLRQCAKVFHFVPPRR